MIFLIKGFRTIVFIFIVGNNNKDEDNSPKTLNDKNQQASSLKFKQETTEEGWRTYRSKRCGNNNKDEDNSPKTLNDKNQQASSLKFKQEATEEGWRTYRPKRCGNNNKDEDNSPKTLNDKNQQASSLKFKQETTEEGWRTYWPKRCGNNNKDEDNSPKTLNDKNRQASSQKCRQLISSRYGPDTIYKWKQLEKLNQKLARMTNHLTFLCRCRDLKLVPPGLTIKIPVHSRRVRKVTERLQQELIRDRIHNNRWKKHQLRLEGNNNEDNRPKTLNAPLVV